MRGQVCERPRHYARRLRQSQTEAERKLWVRVRDRGLGGLKFPRQHSIGPFIADFCCTEAKVIVELDGGHHALKKESDTARTKFLEAHGYRVLRFWDNEVLSSIDSVLQRILSTLGVGHGPSPYPLPRGERGSKGKRGSERPIRMKPSPQRGEGKARGL